jgi:hypothetical protein
MNILADGSSYERDGDVLPAADIIEPQPAHQDRDDQDEHVEDSEVDGPER